MCNDFQLIGHQSGVENLLALPDRVLKHIAIWASAIGHRIITLLTETTSYIAQKCENVWNAFLVRGIQCAALKDLDPGRVSAASKADAIQQSTHAVAGGHLMPEVKAKFANPEIIDWDGPVKDRKPEGVGTCLYKDLSIREGLFQSGELVKGKVISS